MGVHGLLDHITKTPGTRQRVSLREAASELSKRNGKTAKLLCDYYSVLYWLLPSCDHALVRQGRQSADSILYGGDLNQYSLTIQNFVDAVRSLGVEPIFFVDGPPGSNMAEFDGKFSEWRNRYEQKLERGADALHVCDGTGDLLGIHWMLYEAVSIQALSTLRSAEVQLVYCFGEADAQLLEYHRTHLDESLGILSSDTDFAIAPESVLYHTNFVEKDLVAELVSGKMDAPRDIVCEMITPSSVATSLGINVVQLIDLSILCGNDYTRSLNTDLLPWTVLGLPSCKVKHVASWLQTETTHLLDNREMVCFLAQHPQYKLASEYTYQVYCGRDKAALASCTNSNVALLDYVSGEVQTGRLPLACLSILNGVYWKTVVMAPIAVGQPAFNEHTASLRRSLYCILGVKEVLEYGRTNTKVFGVSVVSTKPWFGDTDYADSTETLRFVRTSLSVDEKLATLFNLVAGSHSFGTACDPTSLLSEVWRDGAKSDNQIPSKMVLICSSLIFFQQANARLRPSLCISPAEIEAILVTCLLLAANVPPCHVSTRPCARAVTVAMWFSHVLEQVYLAANILGLSEHLDPPGSVFYPLACVPFLLSSVFYEEPVEPGVGNSLAEAVTIFRMVVGFKPVLKLRAAVLNTSNPPDIHRFLDLFISSMRKIHALKDKLTPTRSLCSSDAHSKLNISFEAEDGKRDADEREASVSSDLSAIELDFDFTGSTTENVDGDVSSEAMIESNNLELSSTQERVVLEEDLYFSSQSQKEEIQIAQEVLPSSVVLELRSTSSSPRPPSTEDEDQEDEAERLTHNEASMGSSESGTRPEAATLIDGGERIRQSGGHAHALPVMEHRNRILELIKSHQVVCIEGETGCGKSTMIPQFILDEGISSDPPKEYRILVTQPRRVAAMKLAERVAEERGERVGKTVGYCIGGERHRSPSTQLTYCTVGYMLQTLVHEPSSIEHYTHIILDEVHERSSQADFAMLVVRKLVACFPTIKIVVMSATMQGDLMVRYFEEVFMLGQVAEPYFVGAKRYPVQWYFMDQLCALADSRVDCWHEEQYKALGSLKRLIQGRAEEKLKLAIATKPEVTTFAMEVCTQAIISQANLGESILVFLPGISEIAHYYETFIDTLEERGITTFFSVFILHSQVPLDDQKDAFRAPPRQRIHVILATNIAESSITLPKLRMVINFGVYRQMEYNSRRHISCLVKKWCSHAACAQRAGRAGRVCEGVAIHLFTKKFYNAVLSEYDPPEMLTAPLAKLVLQAKLIGEKLGMASPSQFLSLAIQPPSLQQMEAALIELANLGAIASVPGEEVSEEAEITLLGRFSLSLPVDLVLSRLILLGIFFGCPLEAIVIVASISVTQDIFSLPSRIVMTSEKAFSSSLWKSMNVRFSYDGGSYSDPMAALRLFKDWISWRKGKTPASTLEGTSVKAKGKPSRPKSRFLLARLFASSMGYAIRWERLLHFEALVSEIASRVLIHVPEDVILHAELQKLAALATHQRSFRWNVSTSKSKTRKSRGDDVCSLDFEICDTDVIKAMLAAAFSHQKLFGARQCESFFKHEQVRAQQALVFMRDRGLDPSRTLYMNGLRQTNALELQILASRVFAAETFVQSAVAGNCGLIEFLPRFSENPKTAVFRSHTAETSTEPIKTPFPLSLHFFWQFGERRTPWRVEGLNTEFTHPKQPFAVSWYRLSTEKERVLVNSWRNLTGLIADPESHNREVFFAVASTIQGCENRSVVSARGITLLPRGPEAILMVLAFEPLTCRQLCLHVDSTSKEITGIKLSSQTTEYDTCLTGADIVRVNKLRSAVSRALSAPSPDGVIQIETIKLVPYLLRDVITRGNVGSAPGFVCSTEMVHDVNHDSQSVDQEPAQRATIEDETGQQDLEVAADEVTTRSALLPTPKLHWEDAWSFVLRPAARVTDSDRNSHFSLDQFQYYPTLQCSLVTPQMRREAEVKSSYICSPVLFEPRELHEFSGRRYRTRSQPDTSAKPQISSKQKNEVEREDDSDSLESYHSESEMSSEVFKLSPHAKPFVPSQGGTSSSQEGASEIPLVVPHASSLGPVPPVMPWNLVSLSLALQRSRSMAVAQQGSAHNGVQDFENPLQMNPLNFAAQSTDISRVLSQLPSFHPDYGFAMPSSPAHDYFSPEGNPSCLPCHPVALQPHLEGHRPEASNLTPEQFASSMENWNRRIRQQNHRGAMSMQSARVHGEVRAPNWQTGSYREPSQLTKHASEGLPVVTASAELSRTRRNIPPTSHSNRQSSSRLENRGSAMTLAHLPERPAISRKEEPHRSEIPAAEHIAPVQTPSTSPSETSVPTPIGGRSSECSGSVSSAGSLFSQNVPDTVLGLHGGTNTSLPSSSVLAGPPPPSPPRHLPTLETRSSPYTSLPLLSQSMGHTSLLGSYPVSKQGKTSPSTGTHQTTTTRGGTMVDSRGVTRNANVLSATSSCERGSVFSSGSPRYGASSECNAPGRDIRSMPSSRLPGGTSVPPAYSGAYHRITPRYHGHNISQQASYRPMSPQWRQPTQPMHTYGRQPTRKPTSINTPRYAAEPPMWLKSLHEKYPHLPLLPTGYEPSVSMSDMSQLYCHSPSIQQASGASNKGFPFTSHRLDSRRPQGFPAPRSTMPRSQDQPLSNLPTLSQTGRRPLASNQRALHSSLPQQSVSRWKPNSGSSSEMDRTWEQTLVSYFVAFLEKQGGEAKDTTLCGMVFEMFRLVYVLPYYIAPPDIRFFYRHPNTFTVVETSDNGFLVRLKQIDITTHGNETTDTLSSAIAREGPFSQASESTVPDKRAVSESPTESVVLSTKSSTTHDKGGNAVVARVSKVSEGDLASRSGRSSGDAGRDSSSVAVETTQKIAGSHSNEMESRSGHDPHDEHSAEAAGSEHLVRGARAVQSNRRGPSEVVKKPPEHGVPDTHFLHSQGAESEMVVTESVECGGYAHAGPSAVQGKKPEKKSMLLQSIAEEFEGHEGRGDSTLDQECDPRERQTSDQAQAVDKGRVEVWEEQDSETREATAQKNETTTISSVQVELSEQESGEEEDQGEQAMDRIVQLKQEESEEEHIEGLEVLDETVESRLSSTEEGIHSVELMDTSVQLQQESVEQDSQREEISMMNLFADEKKIREESEGEFDEKGSLKVEQVTAKVVEEEEEKWESEQEAEKEDWSSASSDSDSSCSSSTMYEEAWDTCSHTEVIKDSWSTDEVTSSSVASSVASSIAMAATEYRIRSPQQWATPPPETPHSMVSHSDDLESPPVYPRELLTPLETVNKCSLTCDGRQQLSGEEDGEVTTEMPLSHPATSFVITPRTATQEGVVVESGTADLSHHPKHGPSAPVSSVAVTDDCNSPDQSASGSTTMAVHKPQKRSPDTKSSSPEVGSAKHMERFFVERLQRRGGEMPYRFLLQEYKRTYGSSVYKPSISFFDHSCVFHVGVAPQFNVKLVPKSQSVHSSSREDDLDGDTTPAELEQRLVYLVEKAGGWCKLSMLSSLYRREYSSELWIKRSFFLQRPHVFRSALRDGATYVGLCSTRARLSSRRPPHFGHEGEERVIRFGVKYLRDHRHGVGFVKLCQEYRSAHRLSHGDIWLDAAFFEKWPEVFTVTKQDKGRIVTLSPTYKEYCTGNETVLERVIALFLSRNGRMCLLSALQSDEKIKRVCRKIDVRLTPAFFSSRPRVFKICQTDTFEDSGSDWYVFLLADADEAGSPIAYSDAPKKKPKNRGRRGRERSERRYLRSAPASSERRRRDEGASKVVKPSSAPAGAVRGSRKEEASEEESGGSRPPPSENVGN